MIRPLRTARLDLVPLSIEHAEVMAAVLADPQLYRFTGGAPPSLDQLRRQYSRQVAGVSPDGTQAWHNWIVCVRDDSAAIGYVQATVTGEQAELGWVIGRHRQGRGYAREAAAAMVEALTADGVRRFVAHVHPGHAASEGVARHVGLAPTGRMVEGENEWAR